MYFPEDKSDSEIRARMRELEREIKAASAELNRLRGEYDGLDRELAHRFNGGWR